MLMPADRILEVLDKELKQLCAALPDGTTEGSATQAITCALRLLSERERSGVEGLQTQFNNLDKVRQTLNDLLSNSSQAIKTQLSSLKDMIKTARQERQFNILEHLWRETLCVGEDLINQVNSDDNIPGSEKNAMVKLLVAFESEDLIGQLGTADDGTEEKQNLEITQDKLTAYLRDRFNDPKIDVTSLQPLAGGFGKETVLFSTQGDALNGDFVMRRDVGENSGLDKDCHLISNEYPVLRAVRDRGFPGPDALWLDTEHALLPGSDFLVMKRSSGRVGGSFFGAQTEIPQNLASILPDIIAQLHSLPPLLELGDLTKSIRRDLWDMPQKDCTENYIREWYNFWRSEVHSPSLALTSLYGWLFDNAPDRQGPPSLLHGDIGFHNFLFDDENLSAVLDWEFAHIGDPAEELGYVKVTIGGAIDWEQFMARYQAAGGTPVDEETLRYFQVWAYVRNASGANVIANRFVTGKADNLKLSVLPHMHIPHFLRGAQALIEQG